MSNFVEIHKKIQHFFVPTRLKVIITVALLVLSYYSTRYVFGWISECFSRQGVGVECEFNFFVLVGGFLLSMVEFIPWVLFRYVLVVCLLYTISCVSEYIIEKIHNEKTKERIQRLVFIFFMCLAIGFGGYIFFRHYLYISRSRYEVRDAMPVFSTEYVVRGVVCIEEMTQYASIRNVSFTTKGDVAYDAHMYEPNFEQFVVYKNKEIGYNFSQVFLLDAGSGVQFSAVTDKGFVVFVQYDNIPFGKSDYDLMEKISDKFIYETVNDRKKQRIFFEDQILGGEYDEIVEKARMSGDAHKTVFVIKKDDAIGLLVCRFEDISKI